ncbi:FAD-dependent oxidoreductase [Agromyces sp. MMS24-JH15]|uniref:FAD-dependent oxidoreductase n=1 Tax=Agromyces sp. MMS24-JH15 TaxID=3243765 RepID=UPI003747BFDA
MTSLWLDRAPAIETDGRDSPRAFDEIVVGAGITGLVAALLLADAGRSVAVLEARSVGAVATGNTTAKVSVLQGAHLQKIRRMTSARVTRAYVDANRAGAAWLLDFAQAHDVPVERRDAVSFAATADGRARVEREAAVAREAGLAVTTADDAGLPFPTFGAVRLADQGQLDPMPLLAALAARFRALGGVIREGVAVVGASASRPVRVRTTDGDFACERLVLATGTPMLDRGLYFAKLTGDRSYAASYRVAEPLPHGMYLSVDPPTRSIRTAPGPGGDLLLVGGYGHGVGRHPSPASRAAALDEWARATWPTAVQTHRWSAQDYETPQGVPFVGWLPRGRGRVFLATGYEKWGLSNAAQCGLTLAADLVGDLPDWARVLRHRTTRPRAFAHGVGMNAAVAKHYAVGWARVLLAPPATDAPPEGMGEVRRVGLRPVAVSTVEGRTCRVSGRCPHLGAIVQWNDAERTWDCPAHASRFAATGERLEGPAKRGLPTVP